MFFQGARQLFFVGVATIVLNTMHVSAIASTIDDSDLQTIENRYDIDQGAVQNAMQGLDVSGQKGTSPQVSIALTPSSPKEGSVIAARATPMFFATPNEKLYYTWYLKRRQCGEDENPNSATKAICDLDKDDKITVNDWKLAAAEILVRGGYDGTNSVSGNSGDDDGYQAVFGGDGEVDSKPKYCYIQDADTGDYFELSDAPLQTYDAFAKEYSFCNLPNRLRDRNDFDWQDHLFANPKHSGLHLGDGSFDSGEERFWGTDPHNPSTAQNGQKDEANAIGVGAQEFSWIYAAGDQVGVAVEGVSMNTTKHGDSSKMIMFAFPKNQCRPKNESVYTNIIKRSRGGQDINVTIKTAKMQPGDFDRCFHDNLIDPARGGQPTNMKVALSSSPENPLGQVFGPNDGSPLGSVVKVQAITQDSVSDPSSIYYQWDIRLSKDGTMNPNFASDNWVGVNNELRDNKQVSALEGNGRKELTINLNFSPEFAANHKQAFGADKTVGYLYITARTRENFDRDQGRGGSGFTVIKFTLAGGTNIRVSTVKTVSGSTGMRVDRDQDICSTGASLAVCAVMQNQIVGVSMPSTGGRFNTYLWTINNKPLECTSAISPRCDVGGANKTSDTVFFPILGNPGERYTVSVTASNSTTGESETLTRVFGIVSPSVSIQPVEIDGAATAQRKLLGYYTDLNDQSVPDYSANVFEIVTGKTLTLRPSFNAANLQGNAQLLWTIDGTAAPAANVDATTGILTLPVTRPADSVMQIGIKGVYYQPQEIRKALLDIWGVSPAVSVETNFESGAQINILSVQSGEEESDDIGFLSLPKRYLGAIVSYVPPSVLFVLRLSLVLALAVFVVGFLQSFVPYRRVPGSVSNPGA